MTRRAYLDIETTGLTRTASNVTVVGVACGNGAALQVRQLFGDQISADSVFEMLDGAERIYTYNGSRFDLPFIKNRLGLDLRKHFVHTDLMYDCWRQNLKGGLKAVEVKLGISRHLVEVDGAMAVRLWWAYVYRNDLHALETLLEYNREDIVNLHWLREKLGVS